MNYAMILNPSLIRPLVLKWNFGFKSFLLLGFSLIVFLAGFYIFQISYVTQSSFAVVEYEKEIAGLDKEFKNLQIDFFDVSSLSSLETALTAKGYEKVGKIHYVQVPNDTVAVK